MDVSFSTPALAALCNSERRLAQRWGPETGRTVARRLVEMAATDAADLSRLPGAVLKEDHRETVITFGGAVEVRGIVEKGEGGNVSVGAGDRIVITGIDVLERKPS